MASEKYAPEKNQIIVTIKTSHGSIGTTLTMPKIYSNIKNRLLMELHYILFLTP